MACTQMWSICVFWYAGSENIVKVLAKLWEVGYVVTVVQQVKTGI